MKSIMTLLIIPLLAVSCNPGKKQVPDQPTGVKPMIISENFGTMPDGRPVELFRLTNSQGLAVAITNYGGIITSIFAPDRNGQFDDIVLGFDSLAPYLGPHPSFGVTVGRFANRIAGAAFTIDGTRYQLAANNGPNHIHGGPEGFSKKLWEAVIGEAGGLPALILGYRSPDGEEGYPGNLEVRVTFTLSDRNELRIEYEARTDKATHINLTNHSYFNLSGGRTSILDHTAEINAQQYLPVDEALIPLGSPAPVNGTAFDFTVPKRIGQDIGSAGMGYDHTFIIVREEPGELAYTARVEDPLSGRFMETYTTQPGVQFYTGNFLNGQVQGKKGVLYEKHWGLCLETHHYPDSPNRSEYPSTLLRPGEIYREVTVYAFGVNPQ
jgi:aldose 1-epimerase